MAPDRDSLPNDLELMKEMYLQLWVSKDEEIKHLLDVIRKHVHARFGSKAETMDPRQLMLAFAEMQRAGNLPPVPDPVSDREKPHTEAARRIEKAGHGRRALPADLPRVEIVHDLSEDEKTCTCGKQMISLPPEVSEQLDYVPSKLRVIRHIRPKYLCAGPHQDDTPRFVTRELPLQPIARGLATPGLLAHLAVSKYDDHLPLYRLEEIFARQQIDLPRSTLCDWVQACAELCTPLYDEMKRRVLQGSVIHADDTNVPTQRREKGSNSCGDLEGEQNSKALRQTLGKGCIWVYAGDQANPYTVFDYTPDRSREGPRRFLEVSAADGSDRKARWRGHLQCDAYSGYENLFARDDKNRLRTVEAACWAHTRRYFYEARSNGGQDALEALAMIARLYHIEHEAKEQGLVGSALAKYRQEHATPITQAFRRWLHARLDAKTGILPKSELGKAIHYAYDNYKALRRYRRLSHLSIDNNAAERALKNVVIGRKNYLFCGSDRGGRSAAVIYTLVESAKRCGANPFEYLRDVLACLPETRHSEVPRLLPDTWLKAHADESGAIPSNLTYAPPSR